MPRPALLVLAALLAFAGPALAQAPVPVGTLAYDKPNARLSLVGRFVTLAVEGVLDFPGNGTFVVTDETSRLLWDVRGNGKKITVETDLASPLFPLRIAAVGATAGTGTAERPVSVVPQDFLLNVGKTEGSCTIRYVSAVLPEQGAGTDRHTITFTITNQ